MNSSLNFIVKEKRQGVSYMSSQLENDLHVIFQNPDDLDDNGEPAVEFKQLRLPGEALCATFAKDETVLFIGCVGGSIQQLALRDSKNPRLGPELRLVEDVNCL